MKMAMLAEPRRKQKLSNDPRNTAWSNDDSKFGQKLMEKMGWAKGKGLGANEDGKTESIAVAVKNNTMGVGCNKTHADKWISHQDDFNALLANLNQNHGPTDNYDADGDVKAQSLEHNSRTTKGRVHYQKFTKGKDLSLKSATDLDCVFGKRKSKSQDNTPQQSEANSDASDTESKDGLKLVTSTDSMQDYFAKKMAERKSKLENGGSGSSTDNLKSEDSQDDVIKEADIKQEESKKKKKKGKKEKKIKEEKVKKRVSFMLGEQGDSDDNSNDSALPEDKSEVEEKVTLKVETMDESNEKVVDSEKKKSKKKKRKIEEDNDCALNETNSTDSIVKIEATNEVDGSGVSVKKKSKKSKRKSEEEINDSEKDEDVNTTTDKNITTETKTDSVPVSVKTNKKSKKEKKAQKATTNTEENSTSDTSLNEVKQETALKGNKTGKKRQNSNTSTETGNTEEKKPKLNNNDTESALGKRLKKISEKSVQEFVGANVDSLEGYRGLAGFGVKKPFNNKQKGKPFNKKK